ncbi:hypothetical protein LCGC14_2510170 [marine sediment metagenome]|uniref:ASCH domain-containing protein n=1 Tax=marine sediment metagenome TaxID=412755 RepID=A0A0F9AZC5_9ZZZZ
MTEIYNALILIDYPGDKKRHFATMVEKQEKTIETRMKEFKYRGDLVICCGSKSKTKNSGLALCVVNLYHVRDMVDSDRSKACIENIPGRKAYLLKNWRYFNKKFPFSKCYASGAYQGIFQIRLPDDIKLSPTGGGKR